MFTKVPYTGDRNIWRGPRPKDLSELDSFKNIINLENDDCYIFREENYCKLKDIDFINISLSGIKRPSIFVLRHITNQIEWLGFRGKTGVQCLHGTDRTGMAIASYRILQQLWTPKEAIKEMRKNGFNWMLFWWPSILYKLR
jgi:hypothetical protein